ncbi:MAG: hypothetical protein HEQ38_19365 [Gemmatimonas sp.]|nr:hypothetical protein [Gemmatimonas sp.]
MLELERGNSRFIDDRLSRAEQERAAGILAVVVARVRVVQERLRKELVPAKPLLETLVVPVLDLRRSVGTRQLDSAADVGLS